MSYSPSSQPPMQLSPPPAEQPPAFSIMRWHNEHQVCRKYFVETGQYDEGTKIVAAFVNIRLPHQIPFSALQQFTSTSQVPWSGMEADIRRKAESSIGLNNPQQSSSNPPIDSYPNVSLYPYIKRLVCTGFDNDRVMVGFFGERWEGGIKPLLEQERENFLLAVRSKNSSWLKVKESYDTGMGYNELVPFLKPLNVEDLRSERAKADRVWKEWENFEGWEAPGSNARGKRRAFDY